MTVLCFCSLHRRQRALFTPWAEDALNHVYACKFAKKWTLRTEDTNAVSALCPVDG
jgi:hypothetical protein